MSRSKSRSITEWELEFDRLLPLFGHRNWIVVADSAYPAHSNPGIETIATGSDHFSVLEKVVRGIFGSGHIRANVYTDQELKLVTEDDIPAFNLYRTEFDRLLKGCEVDELPHEQIIAKLDKAGTLFRVLILKTTLRIPYTSVFFELGCGYWDASAETRLRKRIAEMEPKLQ